VAALAPPCPKLEALAGLCHIEGMESELLAFRPSTSRWLIGSATGWLTLLTIPLLVGLIALAQKAWHHMSTRYRLTNQRLIVTTGIFVRKIDEIELYRIKDITVTYSMFNGWANLGTISLLSSDPTTKNRAFELPDIVDAIALREQIRKLVDEAKYARRVREIDLGLEHDMV
jgi:uncharacterized membrane protein YdbT with pleckstrin-like domain